MNSIQYYLDMFRDNMMNEILNAPTDETTIEYLSDCLKETYSAVLNTALNESK